MRSEKEGRWFVLSVRAPLPGEEPLVVDGLKRLGGRVVEWEGQRLVAYLPPPKDLPTALDEARGVLRSRTRLQDLNLRWEWRARDGAFLEGDRETTPYRVSSRILVVPPGGAVEGEEADLVVRLDPDVAFGTGQHPTTRACVRLLERILEPGATVLDVGAGSGVLSVVAALLGASEVTALEKDPYGCEAILRNASANQVEAVCEVRRVEVRPGGLSAGNTYDVVLANLEAPVLFPLLTTDLFRAVEPGGALVVSGVLEGEGREVVERVVNQGGSVAEELVDEGWWSGMFAVPAGPAED